MKKVINQDYLRVMSEQEEKIKRMEVEIMALKEALYSRDVAINKAQSMNHRESKNPRNSSLSNHKDIQ